MGILSKEQVKQIRKMGLFDFLSTYGHTMSRDDLVGMFKEYNFAVYDRDKSMDTDATEDMIKELQSTED